MKGDNTVVLILLGMMVGLLFGISRTLGEILEVLK